MERSPLRVERDTMGAMNKHILIVDDSADNQQLLKVLLEAHGYTTDSTSNGQEALTLLQTCERLPSAILLDLRMPVMDGFEFQDIKNIDPALKEIPIVVMSGDNESSNAKLKDNTYILQKPFSISSLLEILERNSNLLTHIQM
jgi:CheY-like chemotaxis protein